MLIRKEVKKAAIAREIFSGKISTLIPASFLWLHPDVLYVSDIPSISWAP
ncbi:MAG: hypothetical protein KFF73_12050 [Cyclobacteriaceae bacterium]|nr:hypothetical protein [Cyclobacteriaceae bacterium]